MSQIVWYKKQVEGQKKKEEKPVKVERVEEWEIEKILNKRKIKGVEKYLIHWKGFIVEHDSQERREDLKDAKAVLEDFEGRMEVEIRRQKKLDRAEERDFRRGELPKKFMARMLYGWDYGKFEEEYLKKLERNQKRQKTVSLEEKP